MFWIALGVALLVGLVPVWMAAGMDDHDRWMRGR